MMYGYCLEKISVELKGLGRYFKTFDISLY